MAKMEKDINIQPYLDVISTYEKEFKKWEGRVEKILKRYRDERNQTTSESHYNILWANVQTLKAATYSRMPKPDVSRRFKDNDPVGRVASTLLERALDFEVTHSFDFAESLTASVYDRFLGGRGTTWVRYEPKIITQEADEESGEMVSEDDVATEQESEWLDIETTPVDYVHWKDFGHQVARTWDEVTSGWRKVYMTRAMLRERFPEEKFGNIADIIPLDSSPDDQKMKQTEGVAKRALIIEYWDKEAKEVLWISKSMGKIIDRVPDPLNLEDFFPFPKPLFATLTNDSLVPVPDYILYQDQANELDVLASRIKGLVDALKVRGVYDASEPSLQRLFTEGDNNSLLPITNYGAFAEKNGLKGAIDLVDITPIANALQIAYGAMGQIKQQIYDITGISDIIRGASVASETATAQQIKGQYATLRLKTFQDQVAEFASGILKIKAQIICQHFQPETILKISGADQLSPQDQQYIPQALELMKNNPMRSFRVEVATDSMLYADEQQEKQDRMEFLQATSAFIEKAVQGAQAVPELTPLLMDMLKFGVTGFKIGRAMEGEFDTFADQAKEKQQQLAMQPKQPSPDEIKAQTEQAKLQQETQLEQMRMQLEQQKAQLEVQSEQAKMQLEAQRLEFEKWKTQLENDTKIVIAEMQARKDVTTTMMNINATSESEAEPMESGLSDLVEAVNQNMANLTMAQTQHNQDILMQQQMAHENLVAQLTRPKQVMRDEAGKIIGVQ